MKMIPKFLWLHIRNRPNLIKILENIGWLFFSKILRMSLGLFIGVWLARYLGPVQFGQLNYAIAFVSLFGAFAALGLNGIALRDIVREPENAHTTLGTVFVLQLLGRTIAFLLILGGIFWLRPNDELVRVMVVVLGFSLILKINSVIIYWFEAQVQSKYTIWAESIAFLISVALKIILILLNAPLIAFVWAMFIETIISVIGVFYIYYKQVGGFRKWSWRLGRAKALLRDSWPYILTGMSATLYARVDQLMIPAFLNDHELGLYSASVRLTEAWLFIPMIISASLLPSLVQSKKISKRLYDTNMYHIYGLTCLLSVPIAIFVTLFSGEVLVLIFGNQYVDGSRVLQIRIWEMAFATVGAASGKWVLVEGYQRYAMAFAIAGMLINVLANVILIPIYGIEGAATASVLSIALITLIFPLLKAEMRPDVSRRIKSLILVPYIIFLIKNRKTIGLNKV